MGGMKKMKESKNVYRMEDGREIIIHPEHAPLSYRHGRLKTIEWKPEYSVDNENETT